MAPQFGIEIFFFLLV